MSVKIADLLLVTDMDGTLLTTDKRISEENIAAIRAFQEAGGRFSIATGRSIPSLEPYVRLLKIDTPVILYNGGMIYDFIDRGILWHSVLCGEAKRYTRMVRDLFPDIGIEILIGESIYVVRNNAFVRNHLETEHLSYTEAGLDEVPDGWYKVLFALDPDRMEQLDAYLHEVTNRDVCLVRSFDCYYEMLPLGCSKGGALRKLAEISGLDRERVVAIGDYYNDREMLENAGIGVAVSNAPDELKDLASIVVCDNDHSAVADLIGRLMKMSISER